MDVPPGLIDSAAVLRTGSGTDRIHREFRAGKLVRIRRGFYVPTNDWVAAQPSHRFAWSTVAITRSINGAVLTGQTAALASGLPTLGTPAFVELATTQPGRSGARKSSLQVLGEDSTALEARKIRSYPLRYCLRSGMEPVRHGEFLCVGLAQVTADIMASAALSEALVVADGAARRLSGQWTIAPGSGLMSVPEMAAAISAQPNEAARQRAEFVASLASPLPESVGESYSRAAFEFLGFEQPVLQQVFNDRNGFIGRSDFWWPRQRVVGEFDGKAKYVDPAMRGGISADEAVYREKLREDRIRALGYTFVRWAWSDVQSPDRLKRKLLAAGLRPRQKR